jgi:hypothetical protein
MRSRGMGGMVLGLAVGLAACGGAASTDSQESSVAPVAGASAGASAAGASAPGASAAGATAAASKGGGGGDGSYGSATFVVEDTTYEFSVPQYGCAVQEGNYEAGGKATDGSGDRFSVLFPPTLDQWDAREAYKITITAGDAFWAAYGTTPDEMATWEGPRVDSLDIAGQTATGTFWALDRNEYVTEEPSVFDKMVSGTFEVTCSNW